MPTPTFYSRRQMLQHAGTGLGLLGLAALVSDANETTPHIQMSPR